MPYGDRRDFLDLVEALEGGPSLESIRREEELRHPNPTPALGLSPSTYQQLHTLRRTGESFDTLVRRLIATYESAQHFANEVKGK